MTSAKKNLFEARKERFSRVKPLRAALNRVSQPMFQHYMYQHYTTLGNMLNKISRGEWWLSCCTSDRLNDQKEAVKYGSIKEAHTLYQTCFCHGAAESVAIKNGVKHIGVRAYSYTRLASVTVPNSVTNIDDHAFLGCKELREVIVPVGLTDIHPRAFEGCKRLLDANGKPRLTRVPSTANKGATGRSSK